MPWYQTRACCPCDCAKPCVHTAYPVHDRGFRSLSSGCKPLPGCRLCPCLSVAAFSRRSPSQNNAPACRTKPPSTSQTPPAIVRATTPTTLPVASSFAPNSLTSFYHAVSSASRASYHAACALRVVGVARHSPLAHTTQPEHAPLACRNAMESISRLSGRLLQRFHSQAVSPAPHHRVRPHTKKKATPVRGWPRIPQSAIT